MSTATRARRRPARPAPIRRAPVLADEGVVVAIVAVTGTEDSVQDIIEPRAFAATLRKRRPKVCFNHSWADPIGRVLHIEEWLPGDRRLPKRLPDGRAWPREAGAVVATMQFHLNTARGREMFEHAKEWAKNGEACFSIGYKPNPQRTTRRGDGVRIIRELDLFEVSLVLFGAHDMALALEVKAAEGAPVLDTQDGPAGAIKVDPPEGTQPDFSDGSMVALFPSPEVAAQIAVDGGTPAEELHITLAYLGSDPTSIDGEALAAELSEVMAGIGALSGSVGGLGMFPEGENGTPLWATVDVPELDQLRVLVVDALEAAGYPQQSEHGFTPHMTLGYDLDGLDPLAPVPVEFTEATLVVGTDKWPLSLVNTPAPPMEGKAAAMVALARSMPPRLEGKAASMVALARSLPTTQETKSMYAGSPEDHLAGSYQAISSAVGRALDEHYKKDREGDAEAVRSLWVCTEATFPDSVIYTVTDETLTGPDARQTYQAPYTIDADGNVTLGEPEPVTLTTAVVPDDGTAPEELADDAAIDARFTLPLVDMLRGATATLAAAPEGKSMAEQIRPAFEDLLDQLAVKGLSYSEDDDWSDVTGDEDEGEPPAGDPVGDVPPAGEGEYDDEEEDPVDEDVVEMDPAELDADLADLDATEEDEEEDDEYTV